MYIMLADFSLQQIVCRLEYKKELKKKQQQKWDSSTNNLKIVNIHTRQSYTRQKFEWNQTCM